MKITILRLGHRLVRDERITTHVCLVGRAFGANKLILSGDKEDKILESVNRMNAKWGKPKGGLECEYTTTPLKVIRSFTGIKIHLTMYGEDARTKIEAIIARVKSSTKNKKELSSVLIIVGAEKVPTEVYQLADYNLAVTNQPHSEVAALAIVLDRLVEGKWPEIHGELEIIPAARGKKFKATK